MIIYHLFSFGGVAKTSLGSTKHFSVLEKPLILLEILRLSSNINLQQFFINEAPYRAENLQLVTPDNVISHKTCGRL